MKPRGAGRSGPSSSTKYQSLNGGGGVSGGGSIASFPSARGGSIASFPSAHVLTQTSRQDLRGCPPSWVHADDQAWPLTRRKRHLCECQRGAHRDPALSPLDTWPFS